MTLRITMRRHHLIWWVWQLTETHHDTGATYLIATGASFRKKQANSAADMWRRIYLRNRNLY